MWATFPNIFTFHYASIKTENGSSTIRSETVFTFHYASIKTMVYHPDWGCPPKFTFHYASIKTDLILNSSFPQNDNLHFTMLLLKLFVHN